MFVDFSHDPGVKRFSGRSCSFVSAAGAGMKKGMSSLKYLPPPDEGILKFLR